MGALLARYEWALIECLVIGFAVYELISVNRSIRRDRQRDAALKAGRASDGDS